MRNAIAAVALVGMLWSLSTPPARAQLAPEHVHDLSLLVARELPCVWPIGMTPLAVVPTATIGPSAFAREMLAIDEHTGTQWDAPAHFVPPPDSGLPGAGPNGLVTCEKVPAWQFCGEACVIDISEHRDQALEGASFLIGPAHVRQWEAQHRPLRFGDVVLFNSGYTDEYYRPFPAGNRFVAQPLRKDAPAWPGPKPETMVYLAERGVMALGLDSPSMGPVPDLAAATHQAGGQRGLIWTECATNLGALPATGAFYAILPAKHAGGSGGECRALAITEPALAARLIASARAKRVADLSPTLDEDYPVTWPGRAVGEEASRYVGKTLNAFNPARGPYFARTHLLDSGAGTHLVPPSFALPAESLPADRWSAAIARHREAFEAQYGRLGTGRLTTEQAPLEALLGEAHVVDVRSLVGSTSEADWPASPAITLDFIRQHEAQRAFRPGEVVLFYSGYSDRHWAPLPATPALDRMLAAPLAGKAEGWPAPTPEVVAYLADRSVRCLGTDGPTLGGAGERQALFVAWMAATRGLFVVEYLTNLAAIHDREAFFLFAPIKIAGTHSGYGRALALY